MLNNLKKMWFRLSTPQRWSVLGGLIIAGAGIFTYRLTIPEPKVISPTGPSLGTTQVSNTKPVKIVFSHPVKMSALKHQIHPDLPGHWKLSTDWLEAESTLTFTPSVSPELDTRYTIELSGIQRMFGSHPKNYLLSFQTGTIPIIKSAEPADQAIDVLPDAPIVLTLDTPLPDAVIITPVLTPELTLGAAKISGKTVTFTHEPQFVKNTMYVLRVSMSTVKVDYATNKKLPSSEAKEVFSTSFTTIAAPAIQSFSPTGSGVDAGTVITLEFKQPMDPASTQAAFAISPAVSGAFVWENPQKAVFTPAQPLAKGQAYTVTLAKTAKAASGFTLDEDFSFSFTTLGLVQISAWAPGNGAANVDINSAINVTFNQAVDHASAESKFSITPTVAGTFSWSNNTMIFDPTASLAYNQKYTLRVSKGVTSVKGLDSTADTTAAFTTRNQSVMLQVPSYRQAHMYSCMISAARSAMAFRGVNLSEASIISKVGIDPTKWSGTWGGDNGVWGDPDTAIVGPLDNAAATQPAGKKTTNVYWGYGAHWGPISRAMTSFGVGNDVKTGMTVQDLAREITNNNPVIVWWVNGIWPSYQVNWKTPSGKQIHGVNGLHVQVVRGFTGSVDNPVSFTVTDSGYGYPGRTIDIGTFKARWSWFGNTGIIVK